jgi:hypothetical protein
MSSNSGYISLAIVGAVILGVIGGGIYYSNSLDNTLTPTGMSGYTSGYKRSGDSTGYYYGGRKTHKKKYNNKKTRRT